MNASVILQNSSLAHESYIKQYPEDIDFKDVYESLTHGAHVEEVNYHVHDRLLYHLGNLCIPQGERAHVIMEAHSSRVSGNFGVGKTVEQLQRYCCWPRMNEMTAKYIKGCVMCSKRKPSNRKLGLYMPLPVPSRPWDNISMDFVG